jgi:hypothetical protein
LDDERLISLREAAALSGLSQSHLQLLARTGRLQARRLGIASIASVSSSVVAGVPLRSDPG